MTLSGEDRAARPVVLFSYSPASVRDLLITYRERDAYTRTELDTACISVVYDLSVA